MHSGALVLLEKGPIPIFQRVQIIGLSISKRDLQRAWLKVVEV